MKKYLISTLGMLVATFLLTSQGFSATTIAVQLNLNVPFNDATLSEIPTGSCVMLILASHQTALDGFTTAPDINNPFFLSNGDTLLPAPVTNATDYPAIIPYFSFADFGSSPITYDTAVETEGMVKGTTFQFYVRIFSNLSGTPFSAADPGSPWSADNGYDFLPPSAFDALGNYNGQTLNFGDNKIYYMDSQLFTLTVPDPDATPGAPISFTINPGTFDPLITSEPVPEPGIMLLMAGGLCWIFGRLRKR